MPCLYRDTNRPHTAMLPVCLLSRPLSSSGVLLNIGYTAGLNQESYHIDRVKAKTWTQGPLCTWLATVLEMSGPEVSRIEPSHKATWSVELQDSAAESLPERKDVLLAWKRFQGPPCLWYLPRLALVSQTILERTVDLPFLPSSPTSS